MSEQTRLTRVLAYFSFIIAVLLWGGSFAAMRSLLEGLHPWTIMWFRMALAWIVLLPFSKKLVPKKWEKGDLKGLIPLVLLQPCLYFLLESQALQYTSASQAGIISALVPVLVTLGALVFFRERIPPLKALGIGLSLGGVILLTLLQDTRGSASNAILGNSLELGAMISAASCILMLKKLSRKFNPWTLTGLQITAGFIFFLPGLFFFLRDPQPLWEYPSLFLLIYLGVFVTLIAFGLYSWGISKIPVSQASVFINLVPVTAVLFGRIFLGEQLNHWQTAAGGVILLGVFLSQWAGKSKATGIPDEVRSA